MLDTYLPSKLVPVWIELQSMLRLNIYSKLELLNLIFL